MGIVGSIDHEMLTKGRDSHKYFTKNRMLYERNQVSVLQRPSRRRSIYASKNIVSQKFVSLLFSGKQQVGVLDT